MAGLKILSRKKAQEAQKGADQSVWSAGVFFRAFCASLRQLFVT
jgi:hypothetical protein